jgi:uncharacterized membrane protein YkvA (DUF1232 family)
MLAALRHQAMDLRRQTYALYLASRDPRTPWYAKAFTALVVAYALSPIDLIPDFIPVVGYLDDLLIVPAGIFVSIKLIPAEVMLQAKATAATAEAEGTIASRRGIAIVATTWAVALLLVALIIVKVISR